MVWLTGDGTFGYAVHGEMHHQDTLSALSGGRSDEGAHDVCPASLICEPDNPYDARAVRVEIDGRPVGYIPDHMCAELTDFLRAAGLGGARCWAAIVGGWDRGDGDTGHFGVRLDLIRPYRIYHADPAPPARPRTRRDSVVSDGDVYALAHGETRAQTLRRGRRLYLATWAGLIIFGVAGLLCFMQAWATWNGLALLGAIVFWFVAGRCALALRGRSD